MNSKIDIVSLQLFSLITVGIFTNVMLIYTFFNID